jgi:hypothetical protein
VRPCQDVGKSILELVVKQPSAERSEALVQQLRLARWINLIPMSCRGEALNCCLGGQLTDVFEHLTVFTLVLEFPGANLQLRCSSRDLIRFAPQLNGKPTN